ncbi:MAG: hypothetical protein SCK70_10580, partial [bacterium]|nr:hypothetical protein [bacterium]
MSKQTEITTAHNWENLLRQLIADYPNRSGAEWKRDFSSLEDFLNSVRSQRSKWAELMKLPAGLPATAKKIEISKADQCQRKITFTFCHEMKFSAWYQPPVQKE